MRRTIERGGVDLVGFDADDTLWRSQEHFDAVEARTAEICQRHVDVDAAELGRRLYAVESRNLATLGYGAKAFTLSLVEHAVAVTDGAITAAEITELVALGKDLLERPVELLPDAAEVVARTAARHPTVLITKGDLVHQEAKLERSGLAERFTRVEIVSEKDTATYARILRELGVRPERFVMVGNSLRSDCAPVLALGGAAVHVPAASVWVHEDVEVPDRSERLLSVEGLAALPDALERLGCAAPWAASG